MNVNKKQTQPNTFGETLLEVEKSGDNNSSGVLKYKTREGFLLMRYAAMSKASPQ
jgi:hypothetical protein